MFHLFSALPEHTCLLIIVLFYFAVFFIRKRENIEKELFKALAKRVDGCCRETCPTKEKDMPACGYCIPNARCKNDEKGMFVEVRYFQLLAVDIHDDVKSRYLRQVTEAAEEERAEFELQEKVNLSKNCLFYGNTNFFRVEIEQR